jgi:hypothetical protein
MKILYARDLRKREKEAAVIYNKINRRQKPSISIQRTNTGKKEPSVSSLSQDSSHTLFPMQM